jgi:uncharacterized protein YkwD
MKYPTPGTKSHSYLPRIKNGVLVVCVLGALLMIAALAPQVLTTPLRMQAAVVRSVIVERTNENRTQHADGALRVSPVLQVAAQRKAEDMARKGYFAHMSPDGVTPWYWFGQAGYRFTHAGENLAVRYMDSEAIVRAWMNSPGHRANILNASFTETGIGIASGMYKGKSTVFVVQFFGTPADTPIAGSVPPRTSYIPGPLAMQTAAVLNVLSSPSIDGEVGEATSTAVQVASNEY